MEDQPAPRNPKMLDADVTVLSGLIAKNEAELLSSWLRSQLDAGSLGSGRLKEDELKQQSRQFLREFVQALKSGKLDDINASEWKATRELLGDFSGSRAIQGFTPSETAIFVFYMKEPLFSLLCEEIKNDAERLSNQSWAITKILEKRELL